VLVEGDSFASYEVHRRLAVGGMGEVFLCRHRMLDRFDAVKVLRPHLAAQDDFRRRFLREALSAARLRHPNVVTVYTADEADGLLYLAMEYVPGEDLAAVLNRQGRLDPTRTVRLLAVVADALDAAHRLNLVHRDIKPSNLLVTQAGTARESVVLVDFGISRRIDADGEITRTGEIVGTLAYCAPEQLSAGGVDGACDQYALACVAYECLTGQVPYPREGQLAVMAAHLTAAPPRLGVLRPDLPEAAGVVIGRGMAKSPAARFSSCTEFVAALRTALLASTPADHPEFPGPDSLLRRLARAPELLIRPPAQPEVLALRVGWAGRAPLVLPFTAGPVALRASDTATVTCLGWLLAQLVARHAARDVCLALAAAPGPDESWLWVNWLAHARPTTPPISGPHVATTAEASADLVDRLRALVRTRARGADPSPRVFAVLDDRLGLVDGPGRLDLVEAGRYGVHVLALLREGQPVPTGVSTVDVSADLRGCEVSRPGYPGLDGVPDVVPASYGRQVADLLADD
jgi:hypothetical protein